MSHGKESIEKIRLEIMALVDGELQKEDEKRIRGLIESNQDYKQEFENLSRLKEVTREMKFKSLPDMYWDEYWQHVYNKIERGFSRILISIGAIIVISFAAWSFLERIITDQEINPLLKTGILVLVAGIVVLAVSILREKLMVRKVDKYREVER